MPNVSEQQAEPTNVETGSVGAESTVSPTFSSATSEPTAASPSHEMHVDAPGLVPAQGETSGSDVPKMDGPKIDAPKIDASRIDSSKADAPRSAGKLMIMSAPDRTRDQTWDRSDAASEQEPSPSQEMFGKRRLAALAAVVALAVVAGAIGGALATASMGHFAGGDASSGNRTLQASVERMDSDITALKTSVEHTAKAGVAQFSKANDRLDKVEKAQIEPAARLAKLSDTVDKLRAAPVPVAAAPVAAREVTGSVSAAPTPAAPKVEVARMPTVDGWTLRDVANGGALIEGRQGIFEVYAGDPVPGLGRVDAIRRQDGRWVVVTSKGLIVAR
jgi:outer membrane murein-binding lipoprotein Lpp